MTEFETTHRVLIEDSRKMNKIEEKTVDLVITSPPYPMIDMWDEQFGKLNPEIKEALSSKKGERAFNLMHNELGKVWKNVYRVLKEGGIACINIGDATRKLDDIFQLYPNHSKIINSFRNIGFEVLPTIIWRKPTNSPTKFMGSGMVPPNAYVTLEHEYILVFRKNGTKEFKDSKKRGESAYFWEERNKWFSDLWTDIKGEIQELKNEKLRERTAAYPFKLVYRLIQMYSLYEDTILDPFLGTGTTTAAAMTSGRNSIGVEIKEDFKKVLKEKIENIPRISKDIIKERINKHNEFIENNKVENFKYNSSNYDFPVKTKQEENIKFFAVENVKKIDNRYIAKHIDYKNLQTQEQQKEY